MNTVNPHDNYVCVRINENKSLAAFSLILYIMAVSMIDKSLIISRINLLL